MLWEIKILCSLLLPVLVLCVNVPTKKVLVLGGTGFVGGTVVKKLQEHQIYDVYALSRREVKDLKSTGGRGSTTFLACDCTDFESLDRIFDMYGPFDAVVHSIGLLLDAESGLSSLNKFASGSGSIPSETSTYDRITRLTAFNAIDAVEIRTKAAGKRVPFIFISAAEAGWTLPVPIPWLHKYLIAKRAVENRILSSSETLRPVIFRPSLIWTKEQPQALISVIPFYVASQLGVPFVDRPVQLENLSDAIIAAIESDKESGIKRFRDIDRMSRSIQQ